TKNRFRCVSSLKSKLESEHPKEIYTQVLTLPREWLAEQWSLLAAEHRGQVAPFHFNTNTTNRKFFRPLVRVDQYESQAPLPLRYFFCANSLAASAAREKSKIDPAATSPFKLAVEVSIAM